MTRFIYVFLLLFAVVVCGSCQKEPQDIRTTEDVWFYANVEGGLYLNFMKDGRVSMHCEDDSFFGFYSNDGSYQVNGNAVLFNLQSSSMYSITEHHLITADEDLSHVAYGKVISFTSGTWHDEFPTTYLDCFKNNLFVKYKKATVINGELNNIYDMVKGWKECEVTFKATSIVPWLK